jgi:hypothetical protein
MVPGGSDDEVVDRSLATLQAMGEHDWKYCYIDKTQA